MHTDVFAELENHWHPLYNVSWSVPAMHSLLLTKGRGGQLSVAPAWLRKEVHQHSACRLVLDERKTKQKACLTSAQPWVKPVSHRTLLLSQFTPAACQQPRCFSCLVWAGCCPKMLRNRLLICIIDRRKQDKESLGKGTGGISCNCLMPMSGKVHWEGEERGREERKERDVWK